jgi:O-antigen/teichoic acid export membrane protein
MLGLNSLFTNIIGWLSVVEMGVGSAIVYSLYKPFADKDTKKINAYIRFYGKFYRSIGGIVLAGGLLIAPFLRYFIKDEVDMKIATIGFILFLLNSFITYLFSHRLCILNVAQEAYKITIGTTISKLVISGLQLVLFIYYPNFLLYIAIQLVVNLIYFIVINSYVSKNYSWLGKDKEEIEDTEKKSLLKNIKAMFMHKIGAVVVFSTDSLVISKFIGLTVAASYTNYQMIIMAIQTLISTAVNGITASIGSLLTTGDKEHAYKIHKNLFFLNFWITSFVIISLFNTLNQFIVLWVGAEYLLDTLTFVVILINVFITLMRSSVERFKEGGGNFYRDRYAPICEAVINLVASIILVNYIGLPGVFIGTLISNIMVIFWTQPYIVYRYIFDKKLSAYFTMYFKYLLLGTIPLLITSFITNSLKYDYTISSFIANCLINIVVVNGLYLVIFFKKEEFKYYLTMIKEIIKK